MHQFKVDLKQLPSVHGVVAGPPCQPFGKTGSQYGWEDERTAAFLATLECIAEQANRPASKLLFALIENVIGLAQKQPGAEQSPLADVIEYLQEKIGDIFNIWHWAVETSQLGIPQQRKRIYIGMTRKELFSDSPLHNPEHLTFRQISLRDLLDHRLPDETPSTQTQVNNLAAYIEAAKEKKDGDLPEGAILVCDLSRAAGEVHGTIYRTDGLVPTLTCRNRYLYVESLDDMKPTFHRFLSIPERFMLQGFAPESARFFSTPNDAYDAVGNAMSMPAVGVSLACVLSGIQPRWRAAASP